MKKILLIIPAYNEEKNILNVYNSIKNYNKKTVHLMDRFFIKNNIFAFAL